MDSSAKNAERKESDQIVRSPKRRTEHTASFTAVIH
jgi:hypothetical protein